MHNFNDFLVHDDNMAWKHLSSYWFWGESNGPQWIPLPDTKVHEAYMEHTWGREDPCWPHEVLSGLTKDK